MTSKGVHEQIRLLRLIFVGKLTNAHKAFQTAVTLAVFRSAQGASFPALLNLYTIWNSAGGTCIMLIRSKDQGNRTSKTVEISEQLAYYYFFAV